MRLALQVVASALTSLWVLYVWLLADEPGSTVSVDHELLELHRRAAVLHANRRWRRKPTVLSEVQLEERLDAQESATPLAAAATVHDAGLVDFFACLIHHSHQAKSFSQPSGCN